jgi:NADPH-dependent 2,4-dienoyl-CoA reductase/sulfur reductase-like enzyme
MTRGVVIAGGGLAAQRCCETLRARGYGGPVRVVCAEPEPPYDRPPLSKQLLAGTMAESDVVLRPRAWYEDHGVELLLGARARALRPGARALALSDGRELRYDRLLLATGGRARTLPALEGFANVHVLRSLADARRLRARLLPGARLAVVGAGFIGLEAAATARGLGVEVTVLEALPAPLAHVLGSRLARWLAELHRAEGVDLRTSCRLAAACGNGRVEELVLADGRRVACDAVLVAVGMEPATSWLAGSGLGAAGGVPTDGAGRTSLRHVYAAGDAAAPFDPRAGAHARSEHWDAAARQGAAAARAMLGADPGAPTLPTFWSDQYGVRIQLAGHPRGADGLRLEGDPAQRDFSALLTRAGRPVAGFAAGRPRALARLRRAILDAGGAPGTREPAPSAEMEAA